jgi:hypothetical protein
MPPCWRLEDGDAPPGRRRVVWLKPGERSGELWKQANVER